jgi:predicted nuclease of predicted toxin-antitoxin system
VKFLTDENVAASVVRLLRNQGHDVKAVQHAGLTGAEDNFLIRLAIEEERIIITHDKDFGAILQYPLKEHGGVVLLRLRRPTPQNAAKAIESVLAQVPEEKMRGRVVVVEDARIRISGEKS